MVMAVVQLQLLQIVQLARLLAQLETVAVAQST